jgi:hypothetical protein
VEGGFVPAATGHLCYPAIGMKRWLLHALLMFSLLAPAVANAADKPFVQRVREDLPGDAVDGVKLFVSDSWAVVSQPARLDGSGWLKVAGVLAVGGFLFAYDEDIDRAMQQNRHNDVLERVIDAGDALDTVSLMGKTNRYYAGGIAVGYVFGWEKLQRVSSDILFSHFIAGLVRNGGKLFIGRARPRADLGAYDFGNDGTSLPSGHASTIFQLATILSKHIDWWPASVVFYSAATAVAVERVASREHWASDVWIGAMNGRAIARTIMKEHDEKGILVVPSVTPETGAVGLYLQFDF